MGFTLEHSIKAWDFYSTDLLFTVGITLLSALLIGLVAIAGYVTLGENPRTMVILRWLYRWPLFTPVTPCNVVESRDRTIGRRSRLGGILNYYERRAT